jgi:hypothetical protein
MDYPLQWREKREKVREPNTDLREHLHSWGWMQELRVGEGWYVQCHGNQEVVYSGIKCIREI